MAVWIADQACLSWPRGEQAGYPFTQLWQIKKPFQVLLSSAVPVLHEPVAACPASPSVVADLHVDAEQPGVAERIGCGLFTRDRLKGHQLVFASGNAPSNRLAKAGQTDGCCLLHHQQPAEIGL